MPDNVALFEENLDYVNDDHIHAFAKALVWDELEQQDNLPYKHDDDAEIMGEVQGTMMASNVSPIKPIKITSKSDWYPVHSKMKKPERSPVTNDKVTNEFRASIGYTLLRWPILLFVGSWIIFLCSIYSIVRLYVALLEYYLTWIGQRKKLRDNLRSAKTYEEWIDHALALDNYLNLDKWSLNARFSYYDYKTIKLTIQRLNMLKSSHLDHELLVFLQGCLKSNFAGIENRQLYSHRYFGTKVLVEDYIKLVTECINYITDSKTINLPTKRKFFKIVLKNYGKTALCLSGGACFAYTHFGVIKALLDNDCLPSIISGTSGGGLIAALACTRTDEELKQLLVPQLARKITACEDPWYVWIPRFWKTGARFDTIDWARKAQFFTKGSMTFQESVRRTGRKLNISTVPADPHSPVILCNNITSPNCIIWSALLASSAVPGILKPVVLMMKNPNNNDEIIPFSLGNKWRDGSLRTDIPIDSLNAYYNVNFTIVSQVNPHILLFFYAPKGTVGRPVAISRRYTNKQQFESLRGGFLGTAIEQLLRLEITKWLKIIKSLDLLPHILEQDWLNIWLQRFSGTITVWPRNKLKDFWYILSDPTEDQLEEMLMKGQRSMFPRLHFIKHRLSIERAIEKGRKSTKLTNQIKNDSPITHGGSNGVSTGSDFMIHTVQYDDDDDDTDSSDEEIRLAGPSPFDTNYNESPDDGMFTDSRTASPEFVFEIDKDQDHDQEPRRRYTIF